MAAEKERILTIVCPDIKGISAAVFSAIADESGFVTEASQYGDPDTGVFFMRIVFTMPGENIGKFEEKFIPVRERFKMRAGFYDAKKPLKILVAVSREEHCLNDILHRFRSGHLNVEIAGVVSNHDVLRPLVEWHGIPYHYFPITDKSAQEEKILALFAETGSELLVLARYMQILSPQMVGRLAGRCINIHHSFLPGFKGAKPYHQAYQRGVKLIGATAHFVTEDLDEGPIIEQAVERVGHDKTPEDFIRTGADTESRTLAKALTYYSERRILLNGIKTVVFE